MRVHFIFLGESVIILSLQTSFVLSLEDSFKARAHTLYVGNQGSVSQPHYSLSRPRAPLEHRALGPAKYGPKPPHE